MAFAEHRRGKSKAMNWWSLSVSRPMQKNSGLYRKHRRDIRMIKRPSSSTAFTGTWCLSLRKAFKVLFGKMFRPRIKQNLLPTGHFWWPGFSRKWNAHMITWRIRRRTAVGIDGISIICHGSSSASLLKKCYPRGKIMGEKQVNKHIEEELSARGLLWGETQSSQA